MKVILCMVGMIISIILIPFSPNIFTTIGVLLLLAFSFFQLMLSL